MLVLKDTVSESVLRDAAKGTIFREVYEKKIMGQRQPRSIREMVYMAAISDNTIAWNVFFKSYSIFGDIIFRNAPKIPVGFAVQKNSEFARTLNYYLLR